jgi:hypothetical protein
MAKKGTSKGMGELLGLLKKRPELVHALVFHPTKVKSLLKSKSARKLIPGKNTRAFLHRVSGSEDGGPIALCSHKTAHMCPKGTRGPSYKRSPKTPKGKMLPFDCPRGTLL